MATCRDLIKRSLRKLGAIAAGQEPTADMATDALVSLQSLYLELIGQGVFGRQFDITITDATYTANEQERILCDNLSGVTITLPDQITAPPWWCGYGDGYWSGYGGWWGPDYGVGWLSNCVYPRPPRDGALVTLTDLLSDFSQNYIYDSQIGRWTLIQGLTLNSDAPFYARYQEGIACKLAEILSPEYPALPLNPQVLKGANQFNSAISHRWDAPRTAVAVPFF